MKEKELTTAKIKALARKVREELPERLLKGEKPKLKPSYPRRSQTLQREIEAVAEQSYDQLAGEWHDWLGVAKKYEHKVPGQDRKDMRHTILLELHHARQRDEKPIPELRAYRIASLTVALYWRKLLRIPTMLSLEAEVEDEAGNTIALKETIADDHPLDLSAWLDAKTWLLGCPIRLIEIAHKKLDGKPLSAKDRMYLSRYHKQAQNRLF